MAGRAHKKLLQQLGSDLPPPAAEPESSEEESDVEELDEVPARAPFNPFDLLTDDEVRQEDGTRNLAMAAPACAHMLSNCF